MKDLYFSLSAILIILNIFVSIGIAEDAPDIEWIKTFGGPGSDIGCAVKQTSDGGYVLVGSKRFGKDKGYDIYVVKTDKNGDKEWDKSLGGPSNDYGTSVQITRDGKYIIAGYSCPQTDLCNIRLIKFDASGDEKWHKSFAATPYYNVHSGFTHIPVEESTEGGFLIVFGIMNRQNDICAIKIDKNGNKLWSKVFGYSHNDFPFAIQQTSDGGYIITGYTLSDNSHSFDVLALNVDSDGNKIWEKKFGNREDEYGKAIALTSDDGLMIVGYKNVGRAKIYLIKTDRAGNEVWSKLFEDRFDQIPCAIQQTTDGGYAIAGYTAQRGGGLLDGFIIKINSSGKEEWRKKFGEARIFSAQQTLDGGYVAAGHTGSFGHGKLDALLIKIEGDSRIAAEKGQGSVDQYNLVLLQAIKNGKIEEVKKAIEKGADVNHARRGGYTPLHIFTMREDAETVAYLIKRGADVNAADGARRRTPLHISTMNGHVELVNYLLKAGAEVNAKDKRGKTPLFHAVDSGDIRLVKILVENNADVNTEDRYKETPLHKAAYDGYVKIVRLLLNKGAITGKKNKKGRTALHEASSRGYADIVRNLVGKGADVNAKDKGGRIPLHNAAELGHVETVKLLVDGGANVYAQDGRGNTPIKIAKDGRHNGVYEILKKQPDGKVSFRLSAQDQPMVKKLPVTLTQEHIRKLKSKDYKDRAGAASSLGYLRDRAAVPHLINALNDENAGVRATAASALGQINDKRAVPALIIALNNSNDRDVIVQHRIIKALGLLGDERAVEPLEKILKYGDNRLKRYARIALDLIQD